MRRNGNLALALTLFVTLAPSAALADPCGMVPPLWLGDGVPITRIGVQKTFAFYQDGIESIVLRPGFSGKVDEFGMLIPFPSPPAIRKVADDVFAHVAAAIDPPEVVVDLRIDPRMCCDMEALPAAKASRESGLSLGRRRAEEVVVISREAVGMYDVAVLDAGSAGALERWMDDHGFRYPEGMDVTCQEYVEAGWCFVAVKTRVGQKAGSQPRPGMTEVDVAMPEGAGFDGHVQAMGFRFYTDEFVVPMRLSAFNEGELHNVVYVLTDEPTRIANLPEELVVRQVPGWELYRNLTDPLPLRVIGGEAEDIPEWRSQSLDFERDPRPYNGIARELFASDLLAVQEERLVHPHEEREKDLLAIGERLGLRGPELDLLHAEVLAEAREAVIEEALTRLASMTLSVIDGDFERDVIAAENLEFTAYRMPQTTNQREDYDAKHFGPPPAQGGRIGPPSDGQGPRGTSGNGSRLLGAFALLPLLGLLLLCVRRDGRSRSRSDRKRGSRRAAPRRVARTGARPVASAGLFGAVVVGTLALAHSTEAQGRSAPTRGTLAVEMHLDAQTVEQLLSEERARIETLLEEARRATPIEARGWAIVALAELGGRSARRGLAELQNHGLPLERTWASAALIRTSTTARDLAALTDRTLQDPALVRPAKERWLELMADEDGLVPLAVVLDPLSRSWPLQQALLPALLERDTSEFVATLFGADVKTSARNLAAASLATLSAQGRTDVVPSVLRALRFDPDAQQVAWSGGPLFLPGLSWTREDAEELMGELVAWHLYCDRRELHDEQRQIHNNLNSWNLANLLGFEMPGGDGLDSERWLAIYAKVAGPKALRALLDEELR